MGCSWFAVSTALSGDGDTWAAAYLGEEVTPSFAYLTSLDWSLSQFSLKSTLIGAQNSMERLFTIFVSAISIVVFCSFMSCVSNALAHMRQLSLTSMQQNVVLRRYFHDYSVPYSLRCRIWHYLARNRDHKPHQAQIQALLAELPRHLRYRLHHAKFTGSLLCHPFFRHCHTLDPSVFCRLCSKAVGDVMLNEEETLYPDDDQDVKHMLFVIRGVLVYETTDSGLCGGTFEVQRQRWACELALWASNAKRHGIFRGGYGGCELLLIHGDIFRKVIREGNLSPRSAVFLSNYARLFVERFNVEQRHGQCDTPFFNREETCQFLVGNAQPRQTTQRVFSFDVD